jgi:hypothetical protein
MNIYFLHRCRFKIISSSHPIQNIISSLHIKTKVLHIHQREETPRKTTVHKLGEIDLHYYRNIQFYTRLICTCNPYKSKFHLPISGSKRDEVAGEWRTLHNEELNDLYSSPTIVRVMKSRRMRWTGHVARMGEGRSVYSVLVGKPEEKRPLRRPRRRWEDNIKADIQQMGCGVWTGLSWLRIETSGGHL